MRIILMIDMERNRFGSMHGKIPPERTGEQDSGEKSSFERSFFIKVKILSLNTKIRLENIR